MAEEQPQPIEIDPKFAKAISVRQALEDILAHVDTWRAELGLGREQAKHLVSLAKRGLIEPSLPRQIPYLTQASVLMLQEGADDAVLRAKYDGKTPTETEAYKAFVKETDEIVQRYLRPEEEDKGNPLIKGL